MSINYKITTNSTNEGLIVQEVYSIHDRIHSQVIRYVINTREQQIQEALIALGWTPPQSTTGAKRGP